MQRRVLLLSMLPLALLFAVTVTLARTYHLREAALGRFWFQQGEQHLASGKPANALEDFRNALFYDSENNVVQLRLAEALLADSRLQEANSYLLNLWDRNPGSGEVNLDLAHVAARTGNIDDAVLRYRGAIYGSWEADPSRQRRNTRLELCEFLLANGRTSDAKTELAGLAADTPPDEAILHVQTGQLYLRVGDPAKAFAEFETALRTNPRQSQWLEDAGRAAYDEGDYQKAVTFLEKADRENPAPPIRELLETDMEFLRNDPYLPGLSDEEQSRRTWNAFQKGLERLRNCQGSAGAQPDSSLEIENLVNDAKGLKGSVNLKSLDGDPEMRNDAMGLVFRIEEVTSRSCGTPSGTDQALLLIGRKHDGGDQ